MLARSTDLSGNLHANLLLGLKLSNESTHQTVGLQGSGAAAYTLWVAALTRVRPEAVALALLTAHHPRY